LINASRVCAGKIRIGRPRPGLLQGDVAFCRGEIFFWL
jgi:hypothetical protein